MGLYTLEKIDKKTIRKGCSKGSKELHIGTLGIDDDSNIVFVCKQCSAVIKFEKQTPFI